MASEAVPCPQSRGGTTPLQEVQRGCGVQEGLCEQEVTLAFSARMSPSLSAWRDSGMQMCPLDRVEKWIFTAESVSDGPHQSCKTLKFLATSDVRVLYLCNTAGLHLRIKL